MGQTSKLSSILESPSLARQPCVKAIISANLPPSLRRELEAFIQRNILSDCIRVPPNCLKAHIIKTARKLNMTEKKVNELKKLFRSKIGYDGYYLDAERLRRV